MNPEPDNFHERLVAALSGEDESTLADELTHARAADIAESFELLSDEDRSRVLFALPPTRLPRSWSCLTRRSAVTSSTTSIRSL